MHPPSEDLFAYRDGELAPEKRAYTEAHVMGCSVCRSFIDQVSSLEAELRQSPDRAPEGYLERLHEAVRARIAIAPAEIPAVEGARPDGLADRRVSRGDAGGSRERRHADRDRDSRRERGRVKEAPSLPWAAIVATASAAAAVMVVVVILIKQGPYPRMITPQPKREAARQNSEVRPMRATEGSEEGRDQAEGAAGSRLDAAKKDRLEKRSEKTAMKPGPAPAPASASAPATEQLESRSAAEPSEVFGKMSQDKVAGYAPSAAYAAVLARFGLPPVWDGARVTSEALANAEQDLRSLYVSGAVGGDSARVRLYLAEAVRLRYAPGDSALYDEIQHHYRRAIDLARSDPETARVAEERLRTLER